MKPEIYDYFEQAIKMGASDLILKPGAPPSYRVNKHLIISEDEALAPQQMFDLFLPVLDAKQQENLQNNFNTSSIFTLGSSQTRIRYYIYQQRDGVAGSFRFIPNEVPTVKSLGLPDTLINIASMPRGLFLVTGPVCCGKTLTVAAMAQAINERYARHIITMENPVEIIYKPQQSVFTQVEVGKVISLDPGEGSTIGDFFQCFRPEHGGGSAQHDDPSHFVLPFERSIYAETGEGEAAGGKFE